MHKNLKVTLRTYDFSITMTEFIYFDVYANDTHLVVHVFPKISIYMSELFPIAVLNKNEVQDVHYVLQIRLPNIKKWKVGHMSYL